MDPDPFIYFQLYSLTPSFFFAVALNLTTVAIEAILFILLIASSALFSGAEVALFSLNHKQIEHIRTLETKASKNTLFLLDRPQHLLTSILILNNFVNVAAAIISATITHQVAEAYELPTLLIFILEVVSLTYILLVVSEITPKAIATRHAISFSLKVAFILRFFQWLLTPFTISINYVVRKLSGSLDNSLDELSHDDIKIMADLGEDSGSIDEDEKDLIYSVLDYVDTAVSEVMVGRMDIGAISITDTFPDVLEMIRKNGHTRMPLYDGHLDNILGIIHAKDLLHLLAGDDVPKHINWKAYGRKPFYVPAGQKLNTLFESFRTRATHIAIVVDEYGGTEGLVTLEDIIEEIVGEIQDEHDAPENPLIEKLSETTYRIDAKLTLNDLGDHLDMELDMEEFDFETMGGLLFDLAGDIPALGESFNYKMLSLKVEAIEKHRIVSILIEVNPAKTD